jgi:hypothetical protein
LLNCYWSEGSGYCIEKYCQRVFDNDWPIICNRATFFVIILMNLKVGNVRSSRDIGKFLKVSHESDLSYLPEYSGRAKFMPLSPKTMQIQSVISRVKEELERHCFWHLTQHGLGFLMIKYQLLKMYSLSAAGPQN